MAEIAALSGVKTNFGGGGIRVGVKRAGVIKVDKVLHFVFVTNYLPIIFPR